MGVRDWLKKRNAKDSRANTSNQTDTAHSDENQLQQQQDESREPSEAPDGLDCSNKSPEKVESRRIEDAPIRELWDIAYEKLRKEDGRVIADYEATLIGSVTAGLGQSLNLKQNRREWMQAILQSKMDEVNENKSKLESGDIKAQAKDVMQLVLNVVNSANGYIGSAASSNPYTSIAWTGVSFLLPLFMNVSEEMASLAKGLDYIASLIAQSHMREELYVERYESGSNHPERFQPSRHGRLLLLKNSATRYGLDAVKWNDWAPLVDEIRDQERNFAAVEGMWRDIRRYEERLAIINSFSAMNTNLSALTDREFADLLQWLCDIDPSSMYNAARGRHEAGTCEWLIKNSEEFKTWETSGGSLLWLHGKELTCDSRLGEINPHIFGH
ncbi:hypothetical protein TrVFT333_002184 [Trichoderma virens FT-333]|nr:hypothetical protein TrVFT333_002184 [Trichoderma virens FT-333]